MGRVSERMIELAEAVITTCNLDDSMDTFYAVQEWLIDNTNIEDSIWTVVGAYKKAHN